MKREPERARALEAEAMQSGEHYSIRPAAAVNNWHFFAGRRAVIGKAQAQRKFGVGTDALSRGQSRLPTREAESIEVLMESLFDFLSTLELRSRLLNFRIARESF